MTSLPVEDRRLLALAAVFLPSRLAALFSGMLADGARLLEEATRAATAPRRDRLAALGVVLDADAAPATVDARIRHLLARERPFVAAACRRLGERPFDPDAEPAARALRRLLRELTATAPSADQGPDDGPPAPPDAGVLA